LFSLPPSAVRQTPHSSEGGLQNKILIGKLANENEFRCLPIPHPLSRELPLHKGAGGRPHGVAPTEKCREWLNGRFAEPVGDSRILQAIRESPLRKGFFEWMGYGTSSTASGPPSHRGSVKGKGEGERCDLIFFHI
jgi:hypothetical protein